MSRNTEEIQQKLDEIRKVQDDIITKPATANKGQKHISQRVCLNTQDNKNVILIIPVLLGRQ